MPTGYCACDHSTKYIALHWGVKNWTVWCITRQLEGWGNDQMKTIIHNIFSLHWGCRVTHLHAVLVSEICGEAEKLDFYWSSMFSCRIDWWQNVIGVIEQGQNISVFHYSELYSSILGSIALSGQKDGIKIWKLESLSCLLQTCIVPVFMTQLG